MAAYKDVESRIADLDFGIVWYSELSVFRR